MGFERVKRQHSHIDIAPLVDVVFLLLLFFMLAYQMVSDQGIRIRLPEARSAETQEMSEVVVVADVDGHVHVGGERVDVDDLSQTLASLHTGNDMPLIIRSDREVHVGLLVTIMDAGREAGFTAISVLTEKK